MKYRRRRIHSFLRVVQWRRTWKGEAMLYYIAKVLISALVIVAVSEIAKRSSLFGALIAALPLTSLLAIIWMRLERVETEKITELSQSVFWLVLPSLLLFVLFPALVNRGMHFWLSLSISIAATIILYFILLSILHAFHITL